MDSPMVIVAAGVALASCLSVAVLLIGFRSSSGVSADQAQRLADALHCAVVGKMPGQAMDIAKQMAPDWPVFVVTPEKKEGALETKNVSRAILLVVPKVQLTKIGLNVRAVSVQDRRNTYDGRNISCAL